MTPASKSYNLFGSLGEDFFICQVAFFFVVATLIWAEDLLFGRK